MSAINSSSRLVNRRPTRMPALSTRLPLIRGAFHAVTLPATGRDRARAWALWSTVANENWRLKGRDQVSWRPKTCVLGRGRSCLSRLHSRPRFSSCSCCQNDGSSLRQTRDSRRGGDMARLGRLAIVGAVAALVAAYYGASRVYDREAMMRNIHVLSKKLGRWAMPVFVATHTLAIAICFPYAVGFEAGAAFLFGFLKGVVCVFTAKVLGAALAFGIGRALFRSFPSETGFVRNNKYFSILNNGVAQDGWKFVLLARFSPVPSYIINYGLAATEAHFLRDFFLPTVAGGIPMILQNASLGSLTSAATTDGSKKSIFSFVLPAVGILSGILISWRIKKYASQSFTPSEESMKTSKGSEAEFQQAAVHENRVPGSD